MRTRIQKVHCAERPQKSTPNYQLENRAQPEWFLLLFQVTVTIK